MARDWWYARWDYQTFDGRKWGDPRNGIVPWPWPGASDSRIRTVEKVIGQHRTLGTTLCVTEGTGEINSTICFRKGKPAGDNAS